MVAAFVEIEDAGGHTAGTGNEFFKQAVFELLPGYPVGDVSLRMEAKHILKGQEEERSLSGQIRESQKERGGGFLAPQTPPPLGIPVGPGPWAVSQ